MRLPTATSRLTSPKQKLIEFWGPIRGFWNTFINVNGILEEYD